MSAQSSQTNKTNTSTTTQPPAGDRKPPGKASGTGRAGTTGTPNAGTGAPQDPPVSAPPNPITVPDGYLLMKATKLIHRNRNGVETRVSGSFEVLAQVSTREGTGYGVLVKWCDNRGRPQRLIVESTQFFEHENQTAKAFADRGLDINPQAAAAFVDYIRLSGAQAPHAHLAQRTGWHDETTFVLPGLVAGKPKGDPVIYAPSGESLFRVSGSLFDWRAQIGNKCVGNSRLLLGVSAACAGPLLEAVNESSGGVHLTAENSGGKTTILVAAGSVLGGGSKLGFIGSWRASDNGLEAEAAAHNDTTVFLDELAQVDPKQVEAILYMLGNQRGKSRMTENITARPSLEWRLMVLSSGEVTIQEHARRAGVTLHGGAAVRMLDIPGDAGKNLGCFEDVHGATSAQRFADELKEAALKNYGHPIREFLRKLCALTPEDRRERVLKYRNKFIGACKLDKASREVMRAASRMGLIAAAGEIATEFEVTPWPSGAATAGVLACFRCWLASRGGDNVGHDETRVIEQIKHFLERYGGSRFELLGISRKLIPIVHDRAGYRKPGWFMFLPQVFQEVCKGYDATMAARVLHRRGLLKRGKGTLLYRQRRGKALTYVYCVSAALLDGNEVADSSVGAS